MSKGQFILGRFPETPVIGYDENVKIVQDILVRSGRCEGSSILTECLAKIIWGKVSQRSFSRWVSENDLDEAIEVAQRGLSRIAGNA